MARYTERMSRAPNNAMFRDGGDGGMFASVGLPSVSDPHQLMQTNAA